MLILFVVAAGLASEASVLCVAAPAVPPLRRRRASVVLSSSSFQGLVRQELGQEGGEIGHFLVRGEVIDVDDEQRVIPRADEDVETEQFESKGLLQSPDDGSHFFGRDGRVMMMMRR